MLNTRKLVYILPEVCFVAELLPTKKPHTFSIQSFRQINAPFMEDEELVIENVLKLFRKLEPETYTLVLPDFLFTNTIVDVAETNESKVREYLVSKLLPSLGLSKDTHQLETFILTQHKGKTKVQLSGLEKSILAPVYPVAEERGVVIDAICPLSWTLKSIVSLEPSLSAVELGKHLYVAQHYIGVEQSIFFPTEELSNVVETVKTLRGAEPNLQTLYLLTSTTTGEEVRAKLKNRIPVQQLAEEEADLEGLPAHIKTTIEAGAKTLDIEDYPVPKFKLEKYQTEATVQEEEAEEELPAPTKSAALDQPSIEIFEESLTDTDGEADLPAVAPTLPLAATPLTITKTTLEVEEIDPEELEIKSSGFEEEAIGEDTPELASAKVELEQTQFVDRDTLEDPTEEDKLEKSIEDTLTKESESSDWLDDTLESDEPEEKLPPLASELRPIEPVRQRPIIKNRNSTSSMVRMIGISIAALIITVLVGVGAGFALLRTSENNPAMNQAMAPTPKPSPTTAEVTPVPAATSSATATGSATTITKDNARILVVNATGVSGKAAQLKSKLTTAGYKTVDTGNASGTYGKGNFVLMDKEDSALITQLGKDTSLTVTYGTQKKSTEDSTGRYDLVFVINE